MTTKPNDGLELYVSASIRAADYSSVAGSLHMSKSIALGPLTFAQMGELFGRLEGWADQVRREVVGAEQS